MPLWSGEEGTLGGGGRGKDRGYNGKVCGLGRAYKEVAREIGRDSKNEREREREREREKGRAILEGRREDDEIFLGRHTGRVKEWNSR